MDETQDVPWTSFADGLRRTVLAGRPAFVLDASPSSPALRVATEACLLAGRDIRVLDLAHWPGESPLRLADSACVLDWGRLAAEGEAGLVAAAAAVPAASFGESFAADGVEMLVDALAQASSDPAWDRDNAAALGSPDCHPWELALLRRQLGPCPPLDAYLSRLEASAVEPAPVTTRRLNGLRFLQRTFPDAFDAGLGRPPLSLRGVALGESVLVIRCARQVSVARLCLSLLGATRRQAASAGPPAPVAFLCGDLGTEVDPIPGPALCTPGGENLPHATDIPGLPSLRAEWDAAHRLPGAVAAYEANGVVTAVLRAAGSPGAMMAVRAWPGGRFACAATARMEGIPDDGDADLVAAAVARGVVDPFLDRDGTCGVPGVGPVSFHPLGPHGAGLWGYPYGGDAALALLGPRADLDLASACVEAGGGAMHEWALAGGDRRARRDFLLTWRALGKHGRGMQAAVDAGEPSLPAMAGLLGLDIPRTRRLVGRERMPRHLQGSLPCMAALDVNRLPPAGDARGWEAFVDCMDHVENLNSGRHGPLGVPASALVAPLMRMGRDWPARAQAFGDWGGRLGDGRDMLNAFDRMVRSHMAAEEGSGTAVMLGHATYADLLAASDRWHAHPILSAWDGRSRPRLPDGYAWPALFGGRFEDGDVYAVALTTPLALREEGLPGPDSAGAQGLSHCVSGYRWACASGDTHVVSIRRAVPAGFERLSTLEIARSAAGRILLGGEPYGVVQHKGRGNSAPPPEARRAEGLLLAALSGGALPSVPESLLRRPLPDLPPETGMDAEALHGLWRPLLPRAWGRLDLAGFRQRLAGTSPVELAA